MGEHAGRASARHSDSSSRCGEGRDASCGDEGEQVLENPVVVQQLELVKTPRPCVCQGRGHS